MSDSIPEGQREEAARRQQSLREVGMAALHEGPQRQSIQPEQFRDSFIRAEEKKEFLAGGWRSTLRWYIFFFVLLMLIALGGGILATSFGSTVIVTIMTTLFTLFGVAMTPLPFPIIPEGAIGAGMTIFPTLPGFIFLGLVLVLSLALASIAAAAYLSATTEDLKSDRIGSLRNYSRLAIISGLLFSIPVAIIALPSMPWYFAGLIGLGAGLGALFLIVAALSWLFRKNNGGALVFLRQFFGSLLPEVVSKRVFGLTEDFVPPRPSGDLDPSGAQRTRVIPRDLIPGVRFTPGMSEEKIAAAFTVLERYIRDQFIFELPAYLLEDSSDGTIDAADKDKPLPKLLDLCKFGKLQSARPKLIEFDKALQACREANVDAQKLAPVAEKLGQYKAVELARAMADPQIAVSATVLQLLEDYTPEALEGEAEDPQPNYALLMGNLPNDALGSLLDKIRGVLSAKRAASDSDAKTEGGGAMPPLQEKDEDLAKLQGLEGAIMAQAGPRGLAFSSGSTYSS